MSLSWKRDTSYFKQTAQLWTKTCHLAFSSRFWNLGATYTVHLKLTGKLVLDFLFALIKLFTIGVMAETLRANVDWKSAFWRDGSVSAKFSRSSRRPPRTIFQRKIGRWMPYNFVADSIHTRKLCSRLASSEVQFMTENSRFAFLSPTFGT